MQFPISEQVLHRNEKRFRGRLVFKAHRWLYHSTLGSIVIKKNEEDLEEADPGGRARGREGVPGRPLPSAAAAAGAASVSGFGFRKSTLPQNRPLNVLISNSKQ